jgi:hypothetical protein
MKEPIVSKVNLMLVAVIIVMLMLVVKDWKNASILYFVLGAIIGVVATLAFAPISQK